jgi:hypothetical protein
MAAQLNSSWPAVSPFWVAPDAIATDAIARKMRKLLEHGRHQVRGLEIE